MSKVIVSPSLLSCDFLNIEREIKILNKIENIWYHLDIMDGHFVPNLTFGHPIIAKIASIAKHPLDAHLMVTNPEFYFETLAKNKIHNLTFHYEACKNEQQAKAMIEQAKKYYPSVGISIRPKTDLQTIPMAVLEKINLFLLMSVEPGFGGQSFLPEAFDKLKELNKIRQERKLNFSIQIDGGISEINAKQLTALGVDNFVAGSFVFRVENNNYQKKINQLRE
ncbi:MAG: hypothetical protein A2504_02190 [Bdellovibrionales bacterium RIFOXYD12_FULL_39_22]|nr:MAG: hypothetical protein A2385_12215 [Bdellovibrionales bacterium RIFOXYB1_FULL_39_21]OFZ41405.1 MAG: hypothetical protein A2485_01385 [Bdellovibrionales bacterium RIFOXYC12_FULL_39_17]OFZ45360.1 MAG: hypothetical protein A2404_13400 [Bdellovibrionales bacterium RIFOXYC1_FULL_39_130]OFZ71944.1 MAG: hypothetical protein A2451_04195 [Bdellovibrionales bacterium RIFOXYC2_FULL_39_8]OFZ74556.1 MAG: hypothetical protein A2560_12505 [Bdellovibrionales bacterium RIFOXYD1_FULL_39_84]OFZ92565.1 MAG: